MLVIRELFWSQQRFAGKRGMVAEQIGEPCRGAKKDDQCEIESNNTRMSKRAREIKKNLKKDHHVGR